MLTGDNQATAQEIAQRVGIEDFRAEILPAQKAEIVSALQKEGRIVAMAGDGINDAPALAQADVGIAMGTGTDVALESAGITLLKGDLEGILRARKLSQATMRQHPAESVFRIYLQRAGRADCSGSALSVLWIAAEPDSGGGGDELQFGVGDCEFAALAEGKTVGIRNAVRAWSGTPQFLDCSSSPRR